MNKIVFLIFILSHTALYSQFFYPFKYHIIMDTVPDQFIVSYKKNDTNTVHMSDYIKLVVIDTFSITDYHCTSGINVPMQPINDTFPITKYHCFVIATSDTIFCVDMFDTDYAYFQYYQQFKIKELRLGRQTICNVQDTGVTHHISQITVVLGMHAFLKRTIYSKFPLTRKKIEIIKKYAYYKGAEPMCVKKKRCWISLPEI